MPLSPASAAVWIACLAFIQRADPRLAEPMVKESFHDTIPFQRMKVRLKREIVALKVPGIDTMEAGRHLCRAGRLE